MKNSLDHDLAQHAPHVASDWADELVTELRVLGASGEAIGAALLEVESHLSETNRTATEEFGDPAEYAASLELPDSVHWSRVDLLLLCLSGAVGVLGVSLLIPGLVGLFLGRDAEITPVTIGFIAVATAAFALLAARFSTQLLRFALAHSVWATVVLTIAILGVAFAAIALPNPVLEIPNWLATTLGAVLLLCLVVGMLLRTRRGKGLDDPISFFPTRVKP